MQSAEKIKHNEDKFIHKEESLKRKTEYKKLSKRYSTILNGLQKGTVTLKHSPSDPVMNLYKQGINKFKEPKPIVLKTPKDLDIVGERMTMDIFWSVGRISAPPKFDRAYPIKFFIEKYAGGPFSNIEDKKPV